MTNRQRDAARTAAACFGLLLLGLAFVVLASVGCGQIGPDEILTRAIPGATAVRGRGEPALPPAPTHLRVMPLGDSTTAGNLAGSSWRAPLLAALNAQPDVQTVEFVGSVSAYAAPAPHEGHPGISTATAAGYLPGWLASAKPDVVLILLGTNDQAPAAVPGYISGIVDATLAWSPDVRVLAAPVIYWAENDARRQAFDGALVAALHAHPAYGARLLVADAMADVLAPGDDYLQTTGVNDGVHPGPTGNAKVAEVWRAAGAGLVWQ